MKKYKLLYFGSEDEYFITHKIDQAKSALKIFREIKIICNFSTYKSRIKSSGFKIQDFKFNRRSVNFFEKFKNFYNYFLVVKNYKPNIVQSFLKYTIFGNG